MRALLLTIFAVFVFTGHAQSKKEIIKQLEFKTDSLNYVIASKDTSIDSLQSLYNSSLQSNRDLAKTNLKIQQQLAAAEQLINQLKEDAALQVKNHQEELLRVADSLGNSPQVDSPVYAVFIPNVPNAENANSEDNFDFYSNPDKIIPENVTGQFISYWPEPYTQYPPENIKKEFAKGKYLNGLKNGWWTYKLCNGKMQYEGNYKNGIREGKWINHDFCSDVFEFAKNGNNEYYFSLLCTVFNYYFYTTSNILEDPYNTVEEVTYKNGIPEDFLYYKNSKKELIFKINWKTGVIYYDNNQPLTNQRVTFNYPMFVGMEGKDLELYHRNGKVAYQIKYTGDTTMEYYYEKNGKLDRKVVYDNNENYTVYDATGEITEQAYGAIGTGKYGPECPCQ